MTLPFHFQSSGRHSAKLIQLRRSMLTLIPSLILFITAAALMILRVMRPDFRFSWLAAIAGVLLAFIATLAWQGRMPLEISLPAWQPEGLFQESPSFRGEGLTWPYALSLITLAMAILLTAVARPSLSNSFTWAGTLALTGLGLLAVTANNPLTFLLVWAALDITELITQLASLENPSSNERVVISFSTRATGIGLLLWANILSYSPGTRLDFLSITPQAGLLLVAAAGLRLGVLPLHLPYPAESNLRRGFGTALRLVSAASSLTILAHIPKSIVDSPFAPFIMVLTVVAAIYGGWMWLRAPDELTGRPFWIIGIAALAIASALGGNLSGTVAWGCALILGGGALFLASVQLVWLNRTLLVGAWSLSTLPFSLTAPAWQSGRPVFFLPLLVLAQSLILAGFIRHALRPGGRDSLDTQPGWTRKVYPAGIIILLIAQFLLGFAGWDGARQIGLWPAALTASLLTFILLWATPRFRLLNPVRAHWVQPTSSILDRLYRSLWSLYQLLGRLSAGITETLEGAGGVMWTLLFLVLFISLMSQAKP